MEQRRTEVFGEEDLRIVYESLGEKLSAKTTAAGRYLSWSYIRGDVVRSAKFLLEQRGSVETSELRIFITEVLRQKFEKLPEGTEIVNEKVGTIVIQTTLTEYKARKLSQLKMSEDSRNSGPTITRMLTNNRKELEKSGIKYEDGVWRLTG